ncbi:MAG: hypothetical protein ABR567_02220 [Myxococcales bacterium]|nr:hypothetical protein [Myxococcales bacterium]
MRLAILAAFALCACAGYTHGNETISYDGGPFGVGTGADAGDAGNDAGTDGGVDGGDGGCTVLALNTVSVVDGCFGNGGTYTGSASVDPATACSAQVITGSGAACTGTATGSHDAFDGGCGGLSPCSSSSLPGTIVCANGIGSCSIVVDGGP